ncbi:mycofactocin-coupled SDR family oxidoreductase [Pseudonocardia sp. WMMC193]|uniref:mycofactocin-coupled SDR family oxidoreductase n=1 Tax=Pseudonocardia sp. WMMC193 TaxID=2911965 RepID=UPI001F450FF2|nr:mycofactocin-coupled SDR family oxidoreductase [Pseudonocardia sp. WMMC193]MCF7553496.1 mycofactocin-coupled SDR family oxidoreductase [Pseudonocardia sp. WMMC193]
MAGRVEGKVALITGAARGQGRSHALRLAQEGADIIAVDVCTDVESVPYAGATEADLAETVKQVEDLDRRVVSRVADVRDLGALQEAVAAGMSEFGRIDILAANAGIASFAPAWELDEQTWQTMLDVNLTGVWKSTKAVIPQMIEQGSGSIVLTSSTAGLVAFGNLAHYTAAKHGVVGLMRTLAVELAPHGIRCNTVHPTTVNTDMIHNEAMYTLFMGGAEGADRAGATAAFQTLNGFPVPWVEPVDISNAVLYLASDETRYVTGTTHVVDAGALAPYKAPHE